MNGPAVMVSISLAPGMLAMRQSLLYENHTSYPAPGDLLLYPGGISETEILLAYGGVQFASKMGQLAGNHFITITEGRENLAALGKHVLWQGAQDIEIDWRV